MKPTNEGSFKRFTIKFFDTDGVPFTPTSAQWKLTDTTNVADPTAGKMLQDWTDISPLAESVVITIPSTLNVIIDDTNAYEERTLTVKAEPGNENGQHTEDVKYRVRNLHGFT